MPPTSRGSLLYLLRTHLQARLRYASSTSLPNLPKTLGRTTQVTDKKTIPRILDESAPHHLPQRQPKARYIPFRGPPGAPPIGVRIVNRFSPILRPYVRFIIRTIPWIPPFIVINMHAPFWILPAEGLSMSPFLNGDHDPSTPNTNDRLLIDHRSNVISTVRRGMVIVFRSPYDPQRWAVKRVVAVAGDRVTPMSGYAGGTTPLIVPYGHIWVEGDVEDRDKSIDSNWYGPISLNLIIGRVMYVIWPWRHFAEVRWQDAQLPLDRLQFNAANPVNPDEEMAENVFHNGYAQGILARLRDPTAGVRQQVYEAKKGPKTLQKLLRLSKEEMEKEDPETHALAEALYEEAKAILDENAIKVPAKKAAAYTPKYSNALSAPFVQSEVEPPQQVQQKPAAAAVS